MTAYSDGKPMGPNVRKLLYAAIAKLAVGNGKGVQGGIDLFLVPGRLQAFTRQSLKFVDDALDAVKTANDNPYGDDDEAIAAAILRKTEQRGQSK